MGFPIEAEIKIDPSAPFEDRVGVSSFQLGTDPRIGREVGRHGAGRGADRGFRWSRWVAVAGGFGYVPVAPGTAGSFAGVLLFGCFGLTSMSFAEADFFALYGMGVCGLCFLGIRAAGRAEIDFGRRDDGRIVIDEVVGQLISLSPLVPLLWELRLGSETGVASAIRSGAANHSIFIFSCEVVTGFVLFRLFDVWKPGAVRWAERRFGGGLGVMADDVVAGIYAALCVLALHLAIFERLYASASMTVSTTAVTIGSGASF